MASTGEIIRQGWLVKSPNDSRFYIGPFGRTWKKRWFVLRSGNLPGQCRLDYYHDEKTKGRSRRSLNLDLCSQVDAYLSWPTKAHSAQAELCKWIFDVRMPKRTYFLVAESELEMNEWVSDLCHVCHLQREENNDEEGFLITPPPITTPVTVAPVTGALRHSTPGNRGVARAIGNGYTPSPTAFNPPGVGRRPENNRFTYDTPTNLGPAAALGQISPTIVNAANAWHHNFDREPIGGRNCQMTKATATLNGSAVPTKEPYEKLEDFISGPPRPPRSRERSGASATSGTSSSTSHDRLTMANSSKSLPDDVPRTPPPPLPLPPRTSATFCCSSNPALSHRDNHAPDSYDRPPHGRMPSIDSTMDEPLSQCINGSNHYHQYDGKPAMRHHKDSTHSVASTISLDTHIDLETIVPPPMPPRNGRPSFDSEHHNPQASDYLNTERGPSHVPVNGYDMPPPSSSAPDFSTTASTLPKHWRSGSADRTMHHSHEKQRINYASHSLPRNMQRRRPPLVVKEIEPIDLNVQPPAPGVYVSEQNGANKYTDMRSKLQPYTPMDFSMPEDSYQNVQREVHDASAVYDRPPPIDRSLKPKRTSADSYRRSFDGGPAPDCQRTTDGPQPKLPVRLVVAKQSFKRRPEDKPPIHPSSRGMKAIRDRGDCMEETTVDTYYTNHNNNENKQKGQSAESKSTKPVVYVDMDLPESPAPVTPGLPRSNAQRTEYKKIDPDATRAVKTLRDNNVPPVPHMNSANSQPLFHSLPRANLGFWKRSGTTEFGKNLQML